MSTQQECIVYYSSGNESCMAIVAVKGIGDWGAYLLTHSVAYSSENADYIVDLTARTGEKLPAKVAEAIFEDFTIGWGYYRL